MASLARIKRYHDTIQPPGRRARRLERRAGVDGWTQQVAELERIGRLRHFLSPQLADLVVGDESLLQSHRREIVVVFCDLRGFTTFAETSEPEEVMGVLARVPRGHGHASSTRYEGTLERFTGDGIMVFFNDPVPCDDPAERAVRMARRDPRPRSAALAAGWRRHGHDLALGVGRRAGLRHAGPDRLRGPVRLRRHRAASPTWPPGCATRPSRGRSWSPTGCWPRVERLTPTPSWSGDLEPQGLQPHRAGAQRQRPRREAGEHDDRRHRSDGARRATTLAELGEDERYRAFDDLQRAMPAVWEAMRLDLDDESVVVVPSISLERTTAGSGTLIQAMEERALFLLLLLRQPRLRMVYVTSMPVVGGDRRVLPRAAARRDPQPRPRPAHAGLGR